MNAPQITYCNHAFVDEVIANKKRSTPHNIAYSIIDKLSDIVIDLSKDQLLDLFKSNPFYKQLSKRANRKIIPQINWKDSCDMTNIADEMFFITPGYIDNHKDLRKDMGCLIVSSDTDIHLLNRMDSIRAYSLIPRKNRRVDIEFEEVNSWKDVVSRIDIRPINAAVLIDNFMFNDIDKFNQRKEHSLYDLLKSIIPNNLKNSFHLTIVACNDNGTITKEFAGSIISEIQDLEICKDLEIEFVAHTKKATTHDRAIITNYHYFHAGTGFSVIDNSGIVEVSKGDIKSTFHSIHNCSGFETTKHIQKRSLLWVKEIMENLNNRNSFKIGNNINRLLK